MFFLSATGILDTNFLTVLSSFSNDFRDNVCGFSDPASSKDPCPTHFADKIVQTHTWTQSEMSYRSGPFRREGDVSPFGERSSDARERPNTQLQLQRQEIP